MKFLVCRPDYAPTDWTEIYARDAERAAEVYAELQCSDDPDCYGCFEHGEVVAVKEAQSETWQRFTVTMETVPSFSASPKLEEE